MPKYNLGGPLDLSAYGDSTGGSTRAQAVEDKNVQYAKDNTPMALKVLTGIGNTVGSAIETVVPGVGNFMDLTKAGDNVGLSGVMDVSDKVGGALGTAANLTANVMTGGASGAAGAAMGALGNMGNKEPDLPIAEYGMKLPNAEYGGVTNINGPSHENGGVPLDIDGDGSADIEAEGGEAMTKDFIFSDTLKDPETKKTFADMAKSIENKFKGVEDSLSDKTKDFELSMVKEKNRKAKETKEFQEKLLQLQELEKAAMSQEMDPNLPTAGYGMDMPKEFKYGGGIKNELELPEFKNGGGLWANIHAKRKRIEGGSGERMRTPGSKGAPTEEALKNSARYGADLPKAEDGVIVPLPDLSFVAPPLPQTGLEILARKNATALNNPGVSRYTDMGYVGPNSSNMQLPIAANQNLPKQQNSIVPYSSPFQKDEVVSAPVDPVTGKPSVTDGNKFLLAGSALGPLANAALLAADIAQKPEEVKRKFADSPITRMRYSDKAPLSEIRQQFAGIKGALQGRSPSTTAANLIGAMDKTQRNLAATKFKVEELNKAQDLSYEDRVAAQQLQNINLFNVYEQQDAMNVAARKGAIRQDVQSLIDTSSQGLANVGDIKNQDLTNQIKFSTLNSLYKKYRLPGQTLEDFKKEIGEGASATQFQVK